MPFFQNVFDQEFRQSMPFADRQYSLTFTVQPNVNQSQAMMAWNYEPYDFSTYPTFTINFAIDPQFKNYTSFSVDLTGAVMATDVVNLLNADSNFNQWFTANVVNMGTGKGSTVMIKAIRQKTAIRTYIPNAGADQVLSFNGRCGVAELPSYCERHTIDNRFVFSDGLSALVELDPTDPIDQAVITNAGLDYSVVQPDWLLLGGRVGLFNFQSLMVDGSDRITQIIEYPAGAVAGYLGRKIQYFYNGSQTNPVQIMEAPYVVQTTDLPSFQGGSLTDPS